MSEKSQELQTQLNDLRERARSMFVVLNETIELAGGIARELEAAEKRATIAAATAAAAASTAETATAAAAAQYPSLFDRIMAALQGEFALRSFYELTAQLGASREEICAALDTNNEAYVLKRRRRDGAELIGLESRN